MTSQHDQDHLHDLTYLSHISPSWGQGHIYAENQQGEPFELLDSGERHEHINELMSWSKILDQLNHPVIPPVAWSYFSENNAKVCFQLNHGTSLYDLIKDARLTRIDALYTFYQVALALHALHDLKLTFGNINLQSIYLTPEGQAQLRGWVPPSPHVSFEVRRVNELKQFQYTFYRCIVGYPPPIKHPSSRAPKLAQEEREHQEAWQEWYQDEESRAEAFKLPPQAHLHRSTLFMFDAPPPSAQHIIDQLYPFTDHALSNLISITSEQLAERQRYEGLFERHEELIRRLDQARDHLSAWLLSNRESFSSSVEERESLERLFYETQDLIRTLEMRAERPFVSVHDRGLIKHISKSAQDPRTDAYIPLHEQGPHQKALEKKRRPPNPNEGLSLTNRYQLIADLGHQRPATDDIPQRLSEFILSITEGTPSDNAGPVTSTLHDHAQTNVSPTRDASRFDDSFIQDKLADEEPPPSQLTPHTPNAQQHSSSNLSGWRPDSQETSEHYEAHNKLTLHGPDPEGVDEGSMSPYQYTPAPSHQRRHSQLLAAFYLLLFAFITWYILASPDDTSMVDDNLPTSVTPEPTPKPNVETTEGTTHQGSAEVGGSAEPQGGDDPPPSESPDEPLATAPLADEPSRQAEPVTPQGMVMILGGELFWGTDEVGENQVLQHCKFSPRYYKRRLKQGNEKIEKVCRYLINKTFQHNPLVSVNRSSEQVKPFLIDRYEVSREAYQEACLAQRLVCPPRLSFEGTDARLPITHITFSDASDYCTWRGKRLPTEEEWLFAARGDSMQPYPWGRSAIYADVTKANYKSHKRGKRRGERDGFTGLHKVDEPRLKGESPFGVAHMGGNAREWVRSYSYRLPLAVRGAGYKTPVWGANLMLREAPTDLSLRQEDIGFRCAQDVE